MKEYFIMGNGTGPIPAGDLKPEQMDKSKAPEYDIFRQVYTKLTEEQVESGDRIKKAAQRLWDEMNVCIQESPSEKTRLISIGKTQLELAVMAAIKGVYSPKE